jgi:hypothetical protein
VAGIDGETEQTGESRQEMMKFPLFMVLLIVGCSHHIETKREFVASHHCTLVGVYGSPSTASGKYKTYEPPLGVVSHNLSVGRFEAWSCGNDIDVFITDEDENDHTTHMRR